jgi:hypothetical protein
VIFRNDALEKGMSRIYNTKTHEFIYESRDDVMGIKWTLVSLRNSLTKRYYVVDYRTGEIVYDTDASDRNWTDVESALPQADQVRTFTCTNASDLVQLNKFQGLTSLTLKGMDVEALPAPFDFPDLKTLRIDNLMQLKAFPAHLKGLEKIALRNCISAVNLMELLEGQDNLKELYIINFDLTTEQKSGIRAMFPGAKVVIEGSARLANSELQMVIDGF